MRVSVVMVTYNRAHLLQRSLYRYAHTMGPEDEIIVVDDDSDDYTAELCSDYASVIDLKHIRVRKRGAGWRDCAMNINLGLRAALGEYVIATHPEVIPGNASIQQLYEARGASRYNAAKVYYLTPDQQALIDTVDWGSAASNVRGLPHFYTSATPESHGISAYTPSEMEKHLEWQSWVFGGMLRSEWQRIGGFTEFPQWGSIDVDFLNRRMRLNIQTHTELDIETFVVHQNHDDPRTNVVTPRDMEKALKDLPVYHLPEQAIRHNM